MMFLSLAFAAIMTLCVAIWMNFRGNGIVVVVSNTGAEEMLDVEAALGGELISFGNIAAGDSATGRIVPSADSDVIIRFNAGTQQRRQIRLDMYITGGYRGSINIEIRDGHLESKQDDIHIGLYY